MSFTRVALIRPYSTMSFTREALLEVIREQGECPFRHNGAGSKGQNSQGNREHENCNQGAGSTVIVSKTAAENKPGAYLDI